MKKVILFATAALSCLACEKQNTGAALQLLETNLAEGATWPINKTIEFQFNKALDLNSVSFSSVSIQALPPSFPGAPAAKPVMGSFFLRETNRLSFQPLCPSDESFEDAGLQPGNSFSPVYYELTLQGKLSQSPLRALDGSILESSLTIRFRTPSPPQFPLWDPIPFRSPSLADLESLPKTLGLNLWSAPNDLILFLLDQPVLAHSVQEDSVRAEFTDSETGQIIPIPGITRLHSNCTSQAQAQLSWIPLGILPASQSIRFYLSKTLQGFGFNDRPDIDLLIHTAWVSPTSAPQKDSLCEHFEADQFQDLSGESPTARAHWEPGLIEGAPIFPGKENDIEIEVGPYTQNGSQVVFSTDGGVLKDRYGNWVNFPDGIISVARFIVKSPLPGKSCSFQATGSKPLIIQASKEFRVEKESRLSVTGGHAPDVQGIHTADLPAPAGLGNAGGGNGGRGSPRTDQSDPKGEDGEGPFHQVEQGGTGGHSAFGDTNPYNTRPGGGGGGNWGVLESWEGNWVSFCYGGEHCLDCDECAPDCEGFLPVTNTLGEDGNRGVTLSRDAMLGSYPAQGGKRGPSVFKDSNVENNFFGRKPAGKEILQGELLTVQGGQGGGAGGDNVPCVEFPSGVIFREIDRRGAGGGGGGGVLWVQSLERIMLEGEVRADGGNGGAGEKMDFGHAAAGGGGGGAGGMIVLESPTGVFLGLNARLSARGGDRGAGGGNAAGSSGSSNNCLRKNNTAARGGAGSKGLIEFWLPFDAQTLADCDGDGVPEASIQSGALQLQTDESGSIAEIHCERDILLYSYCDPAPQVCVPHFGSLSSARSPWYYSGFASMHGTLHYEFGGLDSEGWLDSSFPSIYFESTVNGLPSPYPPSARARILFEGANELSPGSAKLDPASIVGPTADPSQLSNKNFLRFSVLFERNAVHAPFSNSLPNPGLRWVKIPCEF